MWIVTIHAGDLSLTDRHVHRALELGALGLVTPKTGPHVGCFSRYVYPVTIDAADTYQCVFTTTPVHPCTTFVASHTGINNPVCTTLILEISDVQGAFIIEFSNDLDVFGAGSMTGLTSPGLVLIARVVREYQTMLAVNIDAILLLMAGLTFIRACIFSCGLVSMDTGYKQHRTKKQYKSEVPVINFHFLEIPPLYVTRPMSASIDID
jgi:hypothetical protein